ncbi:Peroxidase 2 Short=MsP2 [Rhizoctonia solani AG-1 IB]|uniref:Peroxidase 2 Short=MsP2 n=1 Tax=Thanatephorus cucumeris (strain AG1-IB / isolate 7/3/14) TaxID=1108050 RepID=M5C731_THACB|nr:Peroxidase 2 Short=MsP2 [Rhizoctonia solani AG-1 IB]
MSQIPLTAPNPDVINLTNVQGDIILGFPKKKEEFVFFVIQDAAKFKKALLGLNVTTTSDVITARKSIQENKTNQGGLVPIAFLNIAFSKKGLEALGITEDLHDGPFAEGQFAGAKDLGDEGTVGQDGGFDPNWETAFKHRVDSVLLIAGESWASVNEKVVEALTTFGTSIRVVYRLKGSVRPGDQKGHEHFGWADGISNPAVEGISVILCGKAKDPEANRPGWAHEGSFLAFRQLEQLVPEFHKFLADNPVILPGLTREHGSELLGARLVGRWKSGAPIQVTPLQDDPKLAKDRQRNNDFVYPQVSGDDGQTACPYAAHIRKTNPRNDIADAGVERASVIRAGIPYGPEVSLDEKHENHTEHSRGLAFISYQSSLAEGFQFLQISWANNTRFPPQKQVTPGFDPIVGQNNGQARESLGSEAGSQLTLPRDFVVSRGGEYFFSPSINALKTKFAGLSTT